MPFRMLWYERGGAGHAEWFSVDTATGTRTLVNDPASTIKAWAEVDVVAIALTVESAPAVTGPYTTVAGAVINEAAKTATLPVGAGTLKPASSPSRPTAP
jgi:hypothetical protein